MRITRDDSPIPIEGWYSTCSQNWGPQSSLGQWFDILMPALNDPRLVEISWAQGTPKCGPFLAMDLAVQIDMTSVMHTPDEWVQARAELDELMARDMDLYARHRRSSQHSKSSVKYEPGDEMYISPQEYVSGCLKLADRIDELKNTYPGLGADSEDVEAFFITPDGRGHVQVRCLPEDDPFRAQVCSLYYLIDRRFYHVLMSLFGDRCAVTLTRRDDGTPYFRVESFTHE